MTKLYTLGPDGEWLGTVDTAALQPGMSVTPPFTDVAPGPGHNAFVDGAWVTLNDLRGQVFHDPVTGEQVRIERFGETPPPGWEPGESPTVTLARAKSQAWTRAKQERDAQEFGPFVFADHLYDGDAESQRRLNLAVLGAMNAIQSGQEWSIDWTLANNHVVTLNALELLGVVQAMGDQINEAHQLARQRRAAIESATTVEELDAIFAPEA